MSMGAAKAKLLKVNKPLVYVQGSKSFVRRVLLDLVGKECGLVSAMVQKEAKDKGGDNLLALGGLSWKQMSHRKVSGATQGTWMLGTSCNIKKHFFWASKVKRNLGHNLGSLESGTAVPEGKPLATFHGQPVYQAHQRVPAGERQLTVEFPSVFKKNLPVLRQATDREMMELYDLDIPTQKGLQGFWEEKKVRATRGPTNR